MAFLALRFAGPLWDLAGGLDPADCMSEILARWRLRSIGSDFEVGRKMGKTGRRREETQQYCLIPTHQGFA